MNNEFTPEEKLLNLIKKQNSKHEPVTGNNASLPNTQQVQQSVNIQHKASGTSGIISSFRHFNLLIQLIILASAGFLAYQIFFSRFYRDPMNTPLSSTAGPVSLKASDKAVKAKDLNQYKKVLKKKKVFKSIGRPVAAPTKKKEVKRGPGLTERTRGFTLSGILLGDKPQAIIQDKATGNVHYVYSGDKIGDLTVTDVTENSVTISLEEDSVRLTI